MKSVVPTSTLSAETFLGSAIPEQRMQLSAVLQQTFDGGGWLFLDFCKVAGSAREVARIIERLGRASAVDVVDFNEPTSKTLGVLSGAPDEVASVLTSLLPPGDNNPGADYFKRSTNHALTVLIGAMHAVGQPVSLTGLGGLLQSPSALRELHSRVPANHDAGVALGRLLDTAWRGAAVDASRELFQHILGGLAGRIAQISNGLVGHVFGATTPDIDLFDVVKNNSMVYVRLPGGGADSQAMARMISAALRVAIARVEALPAKDRPPMRFMQFNLAQSGPGVPE